MAELILFNKPFQVLSQFTDPRHTPEVPSRATLADWIPQRDVYPAGRLDYDSEGLLLLTSDGPLQHRIASPRHKMAKTYWVQVEGELSEKALTQLARGVDLKDGRTRPARARRIEPPPVWPRTPPVRYRAAIPTCWLELTLTEGRNRQVRRMTAAVGFPTLRLIRYRIGDWTLEGLRPGEYRTVTVHSPAATTAPAKPGKVPAHRRRRFRAP